MPKIHPFILVQRSNPRFFFVLCPSTTHHYRQVAPAPTLPPCDPRIWRRLLPPAPSSTVHHPHAPPTLIESTSTHFPAPESLLSATSSSSSSCLSLSSVRCNDQVGGFRDQNVCTKPSVARGRPSPRRYPSAGKVWAAMRGARRVRVSFRSDPPPAPRHLISCAPRCCWSCMCEGREGMFLASCAKSGSAREPRHAPASIDTKHGVY
jgi:hypothetical protein